MTQTTLSETQTQNSAIRVSWVLPFLLEPLALVEWATLQLSPTFWGVGVPRGDNTPVILVPGFLGSDGYMGYLQAFLKRIGYDPYPANIGRNAQCLQILNDRLKRTVRYVRDKTGRKVVLIPYSLGDTIANNVAKELPDMIAGKISLASPKGAIVANPFAFSAYQIVKARVRRRNEDRESGCYQEGCSCPTVQSIMSNTRSPVPSAAIYTKTDGVVDWYTTLEPEGKGLNIEVPSTHLGMVFNPRVYKVIAQLLHIIVEEKELAFA